MDLIRKTTGRVLILDDDFAVGRSLGLMAEFLGLKSMAMIHPSSFFTVVDEWQPTHVILDLIMPEMGRTDVLEQLAKRCCDARVAISSGLCGQDLSAASALAMELGLNVADSLPKPVKLSDMQTFLCQTGDTALHLAPMGKVQV